MKYRHTLPVTVTCTNVVDVTFESDDKDFNWLDIDNAIHDMDLSAHIDPYNYMATSCDFTTATTEILEVDHEATA